MNTIDKNTSFESDDILLTSFLLTYGITLIDIQQDRPRHFIFLLSDAEKCNELKRQFLNNASAPARALFSQREMLISEIKTRVRDGDNYGYKS
jgi:hypothetical protein